MKIGYRMDGPEHDRKVRTMHYKQLGFAVLACAALSSALAAEVSCRTDSFGTLRCSDGKTYRTDAFGTLRGSDGSAYRTDRFGTTRDKQGNTWRKDSFGTTRGSDGTTCRTDSFGTTRCRK